MKLKKYLNRIVPSILIATFLLLHYFVFLGNASGDIWPLSSWTQSPYDFNPQKLVFCEQESKYPNYLHPFRKVEYKYQVAIGDSYTECDIIERSVSIFNDDMDAISGDALQYWNSETEGPFPRAQVGAEYANIFFFLLQYSILAAYFYSICRKLA